MAGAYCRYCNHRCFVYRVIPDGPHKGWAGHMATCPGGKEHDRQATGYDSTTAINPATQERTEKLSRDLAEAIAAADRAVDRGELHDELFWRSRADDLTRELDDLRS